MGYIIDVTETVAVELRRESFIFHIEKSCGCGEAPEFHYNRVFAMEAAIAEVKKSERFQAWLKKAESK